MGKLKKLRKGASLKRVLKTEKEESQEDQTEPVATDLSQLLFVTGIEGNG